MNALDKNGIETQRKAVFTGLSCPDISLIRGPPGTGKTTVICEIIQQLAVNQGLRVLMVAPTHIAVDNVLERIGFDGPNFLPGHTPYDTLAVVALFLSIYVFMDQLNSDLIQDTGDIESGLGKALDRHHFYHSKRLVQSITSAVRVLDEDGRSMSTSSVICSSTM